MLQYKSQPALSENKGACLTLKMRRRAGSDRKKVCLRLRKRAEVGPDSKQRGVPYIPNEVQRGGGARQKGDAFDTVKKSKNRARQLKKGARLTQRQGGRRGKTEDNASYTVKKCGGGAKQ